MGDKQIEISNLALILDLKKEYIKIIKEDLQPENVRLFFKGKEITNDFFVYTYDIAADTVIAGMISRPPK